MTDSPNDEISSMFTTLNPREAAVIKMRFGLDEYSEHTLEQIGQSLSLTRERVRQIEAKALRKLRASLHEESCQNAIHSQVYNRSILPY